jgi:hypothetical protein
MEKHYHHCHSNTSHVQYVVRECVVLMVLLLLLMVVLVEKNIELTNIYMNPELNFQNTIEQSTTTPAVNKPKPLFVAVGNALGEAAVSGAKKIASVGKKVASLFVPADVKAEVQSEATAPVKKVPKVIEVKKGLYGNTNVLDTGTEVRDVHPKLAAEITTTYKNNPDLPKGILEALLMKESTMGYDNSQKNTKIGDYAWLGGMTQIAKQELIRNGITPDLKTKAGTLDAMAKFWLLKSKGDPDPVHTYNEDYSSGLLDDEQLQKFKDMVDYYSSLYAKH